MNEKKSRCAKCGADALMHNIRILDRQEGLPSAVDLTAEIARHPDALVFKDVVQGRLRATICGNCGYSELFVSNPAELWSMYQSLDRRPGAW